MDAQFAATPQLIACSGNRERLPQYLREGRVPSLYVLAQMFSVA